MTQPDLSKIQDRLYEGVQKFDYFLTGVSAAVLAYSVQSYTPTGHEVIRWLVPVGWVALGVSFYSGLRHQQFLLHPLERQPRNDGTGGAVHRTARCLETRERGCCHLSQ